jgi:hypothetical protein
MPASLTQFLSTCYYIFDPNIYFIISGMRITNMRVIKSCFKFHLQNATIIDARSINYEYRKTIF